MSRTVSHWLRYLLLTNSFHWNVDSQATTGLIFKLFGFKILSRVLAIDWYPNTIDILDITWLITQYKTVSWTEYPALRRSPLFTCKWSRRCGRHFPKKVHFKGHFPTHCFARIFSEPVKRHFPKYSALTGTFSEKLP